MAKKIQAPYDRWKKYALAGRKVERGKEREYRQEIKKTLDRCYTEIRDQVELWYLRYADKEGLTLADARKRLDSADMERYAELAKIYVKNKDFSPQANADMRLYNARLKIDRLNAIEAVIDMELADAFTDMEKYFAGELEAGTAAEFDRYVEVLGANVKRPVERIHNIVHESLKGAKWEDRLWANNERKLKAYLQTTLESALIAGKSPRALTKDFRKRFDVSEDDALTLLNTEMCRCQTKAAQLALTENGDEYYQYLTTNPVHPCDVCKALEDKTAKKPIKVKDMVPGDNAPPMHPDCHCTVSPWVDEAAYRKWLNDYGKD